MKTFQQYNESVRDKMTPKSVDDINQILSLKYNMDPSIFEYLKDNGFEYIKVHNTNYRDLWLGIIFEYKSEKLNYRILFSPSDTIDTLKEKIRLYTIMNSGKTYESLRDKMTPKPEDSIRNDMYDYFKENKVTNEEEYVVQTGVFDNKDNLYLVFDYEDYYEDINRYFRKIIENQEKFEMTIHSDKYTCYPKQKLVFYQDTVMTEAWYFDGSLIDDIIDELMKVELHESVRDMMTPKSEEDIENSMKDITFYRAGKVYNNLVSKTGKITDKILKHLPLIFKCHQEVFYNSNVTVDKYLKEGWKSNDYRNQTDPEEMLKLSFVLTIKKNKKKFLVSEHKTLPYLHCTFTNPSTNRLDMITLKNVKEFKELLNYAGSLYESVRDFLTPKPKDEIKEILDKLPERERIVRGIKMEVYDDKDVDEMLKGLSPREYFIRSMMIERNLPVEKRRLVDKVMPLIKPYKKIKIGDLLTVPPVNKSNFLLSDISDIPNPLLEIVHKITFFNRDEFNKFLKEYEENTHNDVIADEYIRKVYQTNSWKKINCVVAVLKNRNRYGSFERRKNTYIVYDYGKTTGVFRYTKEELDEYEKGQ